MSENSSNPINTTKLLELSQLLEKGIIDQETFEREKNLILTIPVEKEGIAALQFLLFVVFGIVIFVLVKSNEWIFTTGVVGLVAGIFIFGVPILVFLVSILVIKMIIKK